MVKLWISDKLELRYSPTGWPEQPEFKGDYFLHYGPQRQYEERLAKAKKESIPVDGGTIPGSLTHVLMTAEPDSFIDFDGEVEIGWQWLDGGEWVNDSETFCRRMATMGRSIRKIARLSGISCKPDIFEMTYEPAE